MTNNPSNQPTPVAVPTPTGYNYTLPHIPANAYHLLSNLADAIDTAKTKLTGHANKLHDIKTNTNNAVSDVVSNSKGQATDALNTLWTGSQADLNTAQSQLTAITGSQGIGAGTGPADYRATLNENASAIQTGLTALENLQQHLNVSGSVTINTPQLEQWKAEVDTLDSSIANINMAIQLLVMSIYNINDSFTHYCQTGLTPGGTLPLFNKNAFAHQVNSGSPGSGADNGASRLETLVGTDQAIGLMIKADNAGVSYNAIADLLESGMSVDEINKALTGADTLSGKGISNEATNTLFTKGGNIQGALTDTTNLLDKGVNAEYVNQLINKGANLKSTLTDVTNLLDKKVSIEQVNQWTQQEINLKYAKILLDQGVSISDINAGIDNYVGSKTGEKTWNRFLRDNGTNPNSSTIRNGIDNSLKRWAVKGSPEGSLGPDVGRGNGKTFSNHSQVFPPDPKPKIPYPDAKGTVTEYYVDPNGSERILVDESGKAYYYPDHYNPDTRILIPFSYIVKILGR